MTLPKILVILFTFFLFPWLILSIAIHNKTCPKKLSGEKIIYHIDMINFRWDMWCEECGKVFLDQIK